MKQLDQSGNDAQLWMCLVVKVKSYAVQNYCIGTWNIRSMNQGKLDMVAGDSTREHRRLRNQRIKMDGNG